MMEATKELVRGHPLDAGVDIKSSECVIISEGGSRVIRTGLKIAIAPGFVGLLWSKSGLSVSYSLEVGAGCIDSGYTGEVMVHLYNHGANSYKVNIGDKIAQLLVLPVDLGTYTQVEILETDSSRGEAGFGSTGRESGFL